MTVNVELFGFLRKYSPGDNHIFQIEIPHGSTVKYILEELHIPDKEPYIVILNGTHGNENSIVSEGDEVVLMTPIEGG